MYRIQIDGETLKTRVEANEVIYWLLRLEKLFPHSNIEIIRVKIKDENNQRT